MRLQKLSLEEWNVLSGDAHRISFGEERDVSMNTCDYALLVTDDNDQACAYMTCLEMDKKSVYMQHGGGLPAAHGTTKTARAYHLMIAYLKEHYAQISTRVRNRNVAMIRLSLSAGLLIKGLDCLEETTFLTMHWCPGDEVGATNA